MAQAAAKPHTLTVEDVLARLKKLGKPGAAAIYRRHGATGEVWGVSFADLGKLTKQVKRNHALACGLWDSGVVDARTLALMVADPAALTPAVADRWLREANAPVLLQYLARLVARTPFAAEKMESWARSRDDSARTCGCVVMAALLMRGELPDDQCRRHLVSIEKTIHDAPNRTRHAMNMGLIAIGIYRPALEQEAIAAARRIGKVEVDHGETGCKTPDAEQYIIKAKARKRR
jgi:3-methyladenine DNA glycosylase AlkD